jgi:hypothetical protein
MLKNVSKRAGWWLLAIIALVELSGKVLFDIWPIFLADYLGRSQSGSPQTSTGWIVLAPQGKVPLIEQLRFWFWSFEWLLITTISVSSFAIALGNILHPRKSDESSTS